VSVLAKMAWLNIWRNRRRTIIMLLAMTVGLAGILFEQALINGWLDEMVDSAVRTFEGHVKVLGEGYHENPVVENCMEIPSSLHAWLDADPRVRAWSERIVARGLLCTPSHSRVVTVIGIDPDREKAVSDISDAMREGVFLSPGSAGAVMMGHRLAEKIKARLGRKTVLMAQQLGEELGSGAFRVRAIYATGSGGFDENHVYLLKSDAQKLLGLTNRITEVVVMLHDIDQSDSFGEDLARRLKDSPVEALSWKQRLPLVARYLELTGKFVLPYYAVFYLAMAFGIVNTMSMAIADRTAEIGVFLALGMSRSRIVLLLLLEVCWISLLACVTGLVLGGGLVWHFGTRGMDLSRFADAMDFLGMGKVIYPYLTTLGIVISSAVMIAVSLVFCLFPAIRAARRTPVHALRTVR